MRGWDRAERSSPAAAGRGGPAAGTRAGRVRVRCTTGQRTPVPPQTCRVGSPRKGAPTPADVEGELPAGRAAAEPGATDRLFAQLYAELHRLAEHSLRRGDSSLTVSPTTLLHEAYVNMAHRHGASFADRRQFLAYASRVMRGLVIDFVRQRRAAKRGRAFQITLTGEAQPSGEALRAAEEIAQLGEALDELGTFEPGLAELVDLHFFCGFTFGEIAALRGVSERTVQRDWRKARMLLHRTLLGDDPVST